MKTRQTIASATDGIKLLVKRVCERVYTCMLWFNNILFFYFLLFLGMVIYDKEFETKGNEI